MAMVSGDSWASWVGVILGPRTAQRASQHSWGEASSKGMGGLMDSPKDSPKAWLKFDRLCSLICTLTIP